MYSKPQVMFLCPSVSRLGAGIFEVQRQLSKALVCQNLARVDISGLEDEFTFQDKYLWNSGVNLSVFKPIGPRVFGFSSEMTKHALRSNVDVVHLQVLWMYTSFLTYLCSKTKRIPSIITPNGMLDPWALQNSVGKKAIAKLLYERANLSNAACIQANTYREFSDLRSLGLNSPICIVPNGVNLPASSVTDNRAGLTLEKRRILYLGRIHPKKGILDLVQGFAAWRNLENKARVEEVQLVIAGRDENGHLSEIEMLIKELGLTCAEVDSSNSGDVKSNVLLVGPAYGDIKQKLFEGADLFVLPSKSEGQPMVVLEAMAAGVPIMITEECNLPEVFEHDCAIRITSDGESVANGLSRFYEMSLHERNEMSKTALELVRSSFTWDNVARRIAEVYNWVLGGGDRPSSVHI